jgi:preprotein translocase SecE subunit
LTVGAVVGLLFGAFRLFLMPGFYGMLVAFEEQGWFHATPFKPNQGFKVRRATILGLLILGFCGIATLISHRSLGSDRLAANDWYWQIPFTELYLPLIHKIHVTVPLILSVLLLWIAWRVVNWPMFADFLIATEAEINKVSWTTRKRLFQDTIVVLVTTFILTAFLFLIDLLWIKLLSSSPIRVLYVDVRAEQLKQQEKTQW